MEKRRIKSFKHIFLTCIIYFCLSVLGTGAVVGGIVYLSMAIGIVIPANYFENMLRHSEEYMTAYESYDWIPEVCKYVVTGEGSIIETNMEKKDAEWMLDQYKHGNLAPSGTYYYSFEWRNQTCLVNYQVKTFYASAKMNRVLPEPFISAIVLFALLFVLQVMILINYYTKRMKRELEIVQKITDGIRMDQLEAESERSKVREFNEVIESLEHMKQELSQSLKKQWQMEEMRKKQIQALAHDIKTPLTVVMGNTDLLEETCLDTEQMMYAGKIMKSASDMESYLLQLLDVAKTEDVVTIHKSQLSINRLWEEVIRDTKVLVQPKMIQMEVSTQIEKDSIVADEHALKRICFNLISNAIEYTDVNGRILLCLKVLEKQNGIETIIQIEDSGRGFTEQELQNAAEAFYQGDESRSSRKHYGLGLYIVKSLAEHHAGSLELGGSETLGGAKVRVVIPSDDNHKE